MEFVMHINEQIFILSEGAKFRKVSAENACILCRTKETLVEPMGGHCNWEKKENMPVIYFKKNIELSLNSFLLLADIYYFSKCWTAVVLRCKDMKTFSVTYRILPLSTGSYRILHFFDRKLPHRTLFYRKSHLRTASYRFLLLNPHFPNHILGK